ncbi:hypothetical protein N5C39_24950 [Enterobacter bugandensis]|uniref:Uncharacterized protein n=1 Tax=Enterobacter bugandensis TaxID=881260 RepID=A0AA42PWI1_9ENTR|nr:hypothetical protein [Enterobacter bugandensis]MDH1321596.1 hypothetical protein [Enterobacter bugandensis]
MKVSNTMSRKKTVVRKIKHNNNLHVLTNNAFLYHGVRSLLVTNLHSPLYFIDWLYFCCAFELRDFLIHLKNKNGKKYTFIILNDPFINSRMHSPCQWILPAKTQTRDLNLLLLKKINCKQNIDDILTFYNEVTTKALQNPMDLLIIRNLAMGLKTNDVSNRLGVPLKTIYSKLNRLCNIYSKKSIPQLISSLYGI